MVTVTMLETSFSSDALGVGLVLCSGCSAPSVSQSVFTITEEASIWTQTQLS